MENVSEKVGCNKQPLLAFAPRNALFCALGFLVRDNPASLSNEAGLIGRFLRKPVSKPVN
jgi:hypothetical protein